MRFNCVVLHQDRRVMETQVPKASGLKAVDPSLRENLVQGDGPIAVYRMQREQLTRESRRGR
jgi:hypothetical protein